MRSVLVAVLFGGVAAAVPVAGPVAAPAAKPAAAPLQLWIGVFDPRLPVHAPWDNAKLTPVAHGGAVRVLTPQTGAAATGEVVIVHPLLGKTATGKVDRGVVALADFAFDQRDGDDGVIVLPGGTAVAFVAPSKADAAAIRAALVESEALAGVRRALDGLELGAIDVDGRADVVATWSRPTAARCGSTARGSRRASSCSRGAARAGRSSSRRGAARVPPGGLEVESPRWVWPWCCCSSRSARWPRAC